MSGFPFDQILAADPSNPAMVARKGEVLLYAPGDSAKTPIVIWDLSHTMQLANPVLVNDLGFGPAFQHDTLDQVAWEGGGLTGTFESYRGMKDASVAAAEAADASAQSSAGSAQSALSAAASAQAAAGNAGEGAAAEVKVQLGATVDEARQARVAAEAAAALVNAPADVAIEGLIKTPASKTAAALNATFAPKSSAVDPDNSGYDLIILAGQSNVAGRGAVDAKIDITDPRVFQFGAQGSYASVISQATDPLAQVETSGTGLGFGTTFARWYASAAPANRRILLVPTAKGGTPFEGASSPAGWTWKVGRVDVTNLYENAISQAQAALVSAGPNSRISAVLWLQGESDGDNATSGATYQADLDALIDGFRSRLAIPDLPFVVGQMVPDYLSSGTRAAIDVAHSGTPARKAHTGFAYGLPKANNSDGNHYNAAGQRYLGRAIFDVYRSVITGTTIAAPGQVTGLAAGAPASTSIPLSWTGASTSLAYVVEYRVSPSGAWVASTSTTSNKAVVSGINPGTAYDFRVTSRNAAGAGIASVTVTATTAAPLPLLNTVSATAARAYSTRKLRTAYAGSAIRVRRSSDNTEQDIGFVAGALDTAALLTFAGAGSAFIKTWYDQSGGGLDLTQSANASQPRIVLSGSLDTLNGKPSAVFDGAASHFAATTAGLYAAGSSSIMLVISGAAGQGGARIVAEGSSANVNPQYVPVAISADSSMNMAYSYIRNDANVAVVPDSGGGTAAVLTGSAHQASAVDTGASISRYTDGATSKVETYTRSGTLTMDRLTIGALTRTTVSSYFSGKIPEIIIWASALTDADRQAGEGNQKAFFATP